MQNNLIRLLDNDAHFHNFCPFCHYWIAGEDYGAEYCPHCGEQLLWSSDKAKDYHKMNFDYSIEYYERLKNGK